MANGKLNIEKKEGRELERPHDALQLDIKKNNPNWFEPPPLRSFRRPQGGGGRLSLKGFARRYNAWKMWHGGGGGPEVLNHSAKSLSRLVGPPRELKL